MFSFCFSGAITPDPAALLCPGPGQWVLLVKPQLLESCVYGIAPEKQSQAAVWKGRCVLPVEVMFCGWKRALTEGGAADLRLLPAITAIEDMETFL